MEYGEYKIQDFTDILSSKAAVPGGGGASALVGAVGIALGNMVGALTVGKKTYADVEDEVRSWMSEADTLRRELLSDMDADAGAFLPLSKAYAIPKDDPSREDVMEAALVTACEAPLALMRRLCRAIELLEGFAAKGSRLALSDAGVGAVCCKAALQGAALNIDINVKSMKDISRASDFSLAADAMLSEYSVRADKIYERVAEQLKKE